MSPGWAVFSSWWNAGMWSAIAAMMAMLSLPARMSFCILVSIFPATQPMFSTHQNKPRIISLLHRLRGSCGTTIASYRVQTVSLWTPPGDALIPSVS